MIVNCKWLTLYFTIAVDLQNILGFWSADSLQELYFENKLKTNFKIVHRQDQKVRPHCWALCRTGCQFSRSSPSARTFLSVEIPSLHCKVRTDTILLRMRTSVLDRYTSSPRVGTIQWGIYLIIILLELIVRYLSYLPHDTSTLINEMTLPICFHFYLSHPLDCRQVKLRDR